MATLPNGSSEFYTTYQFLPLDEEEPENSEPAELVKYTYAADGTLINCDAGMNVDVEQMEHFFGNVVDSVIVNGDEVPDGYKSVDITYDIKEGAPPSGFFPTPADAQTCREAFDNGADARRALEEAPSLSIGVGTTGLDFEEDSGLDEDMPETEFEEEVEGVIEDEDNDEDRKLCAHCSDKGEKQFAALAAMGQFFQEKKATIANIRKPLFDAKKPRDKDCKIDNTHHTNRCSLYESGFMNAYFEAGTICEKSAMTFFDNYAKKEGTGKNRMMKWPAKEANFRKGKIFGPCKEHKDSYVKLMKYKAEYKRLVDGVIDIQALAYISSQYTKNTETAKMDVATFERMRPEFAGNKPQCTILRHFEGDGAVLWQKGGLLSGSMPTFSGHVGSGCMIQGPTTEAGIFSPGAGKAGRKTCTFVFNGSDDIGDWSRNGRGLFHDKKVGPNCVGKQGVCASGNHKDGVYYMHEGFVASFEDFTKGDNSGRGFDGRTIQELVQECREEHAREDYSRGPVIFVGHSLGAGIANVAYTYFGRNPHDHLITFGSPRPYRKKTKRNGRTYEPPKCLHERNRWYHESDFVSGGMLGAQIKYMHAQRGWETRRICPNKAWLWGCKSGYMYKKIKTGCNADAGSSFNLGTIGASIRAFLGENKAFRNLFLEEGSEKDSIFPCWLFGKTQFAAPHHILNYQVAYTGGWSTKCMEGNSNINFFQGCASIALNIVSNIDKIGNWLNKILGVINNVVSVFNFLF